MREPIFCAPNAVLASASGGFRIVSDRPTVDTQSCFTSGLCRRMAYVIKDASLVVVCQRVPFGDGLNDRTAAVVSEATRIIIQRIHCFETNSHTAYCKTIEDCARTSYRPIRGSKPHLNIALASPSRPSVDVDRNQRLLTHRPSPSTSLKVTQLGRTALK